MTRNAAAQLTPKYRADLLETLETASSATQTATTAG